MLAFEGLILGISMSRAAVHMAVGRAGSLASPRGDSYREVAHATCFHQRKVVGREEGGQKWSRGRTDGQTDRKMVQGSMGRKARRH